MADHMRLQLDFVPPEDEGECTIQRFNSWEAPRLPGLRHTSMRRWLSGPTWVPPATQPLVRHRSLDGSRRVITNHRTPPRGFVIEYDLGLTHVFAQPGTKRLIATELTYDHKRSAFRPRAQQRYFHTAFEGSLDDGYSALGYVEEAPLPMLDALELRRDPETGEELLVAGVDDPLYETTLPLKTLGFLESYPIQPRRPSDPRIHWGLTTLWRTRDDTRWRHNYEATEMPVPDSVALGGVWMRGGNAFVALHRQPDGSLSSELLSRASRRDQPTAVKLRWACAPLGWSEGRPRAWAARAAASRMRRLLAAEGRSIPQSAQGLALQDLPLGYLRRGPAPGWSPLFSATHPALDDQYLTRSELEATDMGYAVDGVLGYTLDTLAERSYRAFSEEVKWASRFGQRRRYVEGFVV